MVTRNLTIYKTNSNGEKEQIKPPYREGIDFIGGTLTIYVAVDNDFDNDSYSVRCDSNDILIKQEGNTVKLVIQPNYDNITRDFIVIFEHNIDANDEIPLLVRQQFQPYNIITRPIRNNTATTGCCELQEGQTLEKAGECFFYSAKDGRSVEKTAYRIRDNVFLNDDEDEVIEDFDGLSIAQTELTEYIYYNNTTNERIYAEAYDDLSFEEQENYTPLYYIFINEEYNIIVTTPDGSADYEPYRYSSEGTDTISAYQWSLLPEYSTEEELGQDHYDTVEYIKVYEVDENVPKRPRYVYNATSYRNTLTQEEYANLSERSKSGCVPLTYVNIYHNDIKISADEYENLVLSKRYDYKPFYYVVLDNLDKTTCVTVIEVEEYETYPIEGQFDYLINTYINANGYWYIRNLQNDKTWQDIKYYCWSVEHGDSQDYNMIYQDIYTTSLEPNVGEYVWLWVTGDGVSYDMMSSEMVSENFKINNIQFNPYYREISVEEYEEYPEYGQIDYIPYQYICHTAVDIYNVNDIIDFLTYNGLTNSIKENFRIYRYCREIYDKTIRKWQHKDNGKMINQEEYDNLTPAEKSNYTLIVIDGENWYQHQEIILSDSEYNALTSGKENYIEFFDVIETDTYVHAGGDVIACVPQDIITPSKYEILPTYGRNSYEPYGMTYRESNMGFSTFEEPVYTENDIEVITFEEYLNIKLTRSDYVVDSVTLVDNILTCDKFDELDGEQQGKYEICYRLDNVYNDDVKKEKILEVDVMCVGGSYDYIINGITKYKRSTTYSYFEDDLTFENINYTINRGEVYIDNSVPFKLVKQRGGGRFDINGDMYSKNKLFIVVYGWLDSTFIDGKLDKDVFYRISLAHKDVVGLDATIKIEFNNDKKTLHKLEPLEQKVQYAPPVYYYKPEIEVIEPDIDEEETITPSVSCDVEDVLTFPANETTKFVQVTTTPEDSAISISCTGTFIKERVVNGHIVKITVKKNPFGVERACVCKITNREYPSYITTFTIKQLGV